MEPIVHGQEEDVVVYVAWSVIIQFDKYSTQESFMVYITAFHFKDVVILETPIWGKFSFKA